MEVIEIYIDTKFSGRADAGQGAYCYVMAYQKKNKEVVTRFEANGFSNTTINRIYLYALINALKRMKKKCEIKIYANNDYVKGALNLGRIVIWKSKSWLKKNELMHNADLLQELDQELGNHEVKVFDYKNSIFKSKIDFELTNVKDFMKDRR